MIIGIKYITGSIEEKANYKKSMVPYVIGCILLFGASTIAPYIMEIFKGATEAEQVGNITLGIIRVIGTFVAVGTLMVIGIKYMTGSIEERASYKKSMMPFIIGAILLFAAVNITSAVYDMITEQTQDETTPSGGGKPELDIPGRDHDFRYETPN